MSIVGKSSSIKLRGQCFNSQAEYASVCAYVISLHFRLHSIAAGYK
ncbi:MAG: hypothetical protein U9Q66_03015 [Patescibacteria group bacterium]|nr:hypothetical protein [Patescibacteria group bacterium]